MRPFLTLSAGLILTFCLTLPAFAADNSPLRVIQGSHPLDEYAIGALRVALAQLDPPIAVSVKNEQVTQTRVIEEVKLKRVDVMWLASNQEAEDTLLPIRFPLLKGLLGYRLNIINPLNQGTFKAVKNVADLQKLKFGQGSGWPDVEILRANNLQVITTSKYENLFYMLEGGRFDGFPRGVLEPWVEIEAHKDLGLTVDSEVVMVYELPFYFFVDPENRNLANLISQGLEKALSNGAFDQYFFGHQMIRGALGKAHLAERKVFNLKNPSLPVQTPLGRKELWFDINSAE